MYSLKSCTAYSKRGGFSYLEVVGMIRGRVKPPCLPSKAPFTVISSRLSILTCPSSSSIKEGVRPPDEFSYPGRMNGWVSKKKDRTRSIRVIMFMVVGNKSGFQRNFKGLFPVLNVPNFSGIRIVGVFSKKSLAKQKQ